MKVSHTEFAVISEINNLIIYKSHKSNCVKMKPKDPIWNFYHTLNDKKKKKTTTSVRSLDCNAEVSAKVLRLMMSTLGRDETVHFFLFS